MTRQGYLKWKDTDVFKHWVDGGDVQMKTINDSWVDVSPVITWYESADYRKKPSNKWDGTEVYEHWLNGGKVESELAIGGWGIHENPLWFDDINYRIPPGHWIRTEPCKDRWILRELVDGQIIKVWHAEGNFWRSKNGDSHNVAFIPNKWAEIPKDGDEIKPTFER